MRLVFAGTSDFAVPAMLSAHAAGHELALVVTQPDRPGNRGRISASPVKAAAQPLGLEVFQPPRLSQPESVAKLAAAEPEVIVVVAYGQILRPSVLELAPRGVLNLHGSLLPRHRGAAPIAAAILAGDAVTGVTLMQMDELLDHGPCLAQVATEILPGERRQELSDRLARLGASLLVQSLPRLDELQPVPQDESQATFAPRLSRADGELDWSLPAAEIDRRVRALQPWPGVTLPFAGKRVKVLKGRAGEGGGALGQVLRRVGPALEVACGEGSYLLEEVQFPGGRPGAGATLRGDSAY